MKRAFWKTLADRTLYYVPKTEHDSSYTEEKAYASDGRPLRFVNYSNEPSGDFAVFEGASEHPQRVDRIEQNPTLVQEMFQKVWDENAPPGLGTLSSLGPLNSLLPNVKLYKQFEEAKEQKDLSAQARALSFLLLNKKAWLPIVSLPPPVEMDRPKNNDGQKTKPEEIENPTKDDDTGGSWKWWLGGSVALLAVLFAAGQGEE